MTIPHPLHNLKFSNKKMSVKTLIFCTGLIICSTPFLAAVESIPSAPLDQVPQNIRTQLEQAAGGAAISEVTVDRTHGDPRYVARYRDSGSKEMRTVTLGQTGNVIESGVIPVGGPGVAEGDVRGDTPEPSKTVPTDGPVPAVPPKRVSAPGKADAPGTTSPTSTNKDQPTDPQKKTSSQDASESQKSEAAIPRFTPPETPDTRSKPVDTPQKDEDRDSSKNPVVAPKKSDSSAPQQKKSADQKKP